MQRVNLDTNVIPARPQPTPLWPLNLWQPFRVEGFGLGSWTFRRPLYQKVTRYRVCLERGLTMGWALFSCMKHSEGIANWELSVKNLSSIWGINYSVLKLYLGSIHSRDVPLSANLAKWLIYDPLIEIFTFTLLCSFLNTISTYTNPTIFLFLSSSTSLSSDTLCGCIHCSLVS